MQDQNWINTLIQEALNEDSGKGDHSSDACIPKDQQASAEIFSRQSGIVSGAEIAKQVFTTCDPNIKIKIHLQDSSSLSPDDVILEICGSARSILRAERVALNFLQRLTAIASVTNQLVNRIRPYGTNLLDTRKTTPGWRILEKKAVKDGGGENHRMGLYDMVMLKDNHIDYSGGIRQALNNTYKYLEENNLKIPIVVEARSLKEVKEILASANVDRILLDNFSPDELKNAVQQIKGSVKTEASGGINFENIEEIAATGVDYISTSLMTQAPGQFDLSLRAI